MIAPTTRKPTRTESCLCCSTTPSARYTILLRACRRVADSQRARLWLSRMEEVGQNDHTVLGSIYIPTTKSNIQRMIGEVSNFTSLQLLLFSVLISGLHLGHQVKLPGGDWSRIAGSQCFAGSTGSWSRLCCCRAIVKGPGKNAWWSDFFWWNDMVVEAETVYLIYVFLVTKLESLCCHPIEMMVRLGTDQFDTPWKVKVTKFCH